MWFQKTLDDYKIPGWFLVTAKQKTPDQKDYLLEVVNHAGKLLQLLWPVETADGLGGPVLYRTWSDQFKRFNSFIEIQTGQRHWVRADIDRFAQQIVSHLTPDSLSIGIVTDTHAKPDQNKTYYGVNGLEHVKELNLLDETGLIDWRAHLGDLIDGSDNGKSSSAMLQEVNAALREGHSPYFVTKGNHDENDKYNERHRMRASFSSQQFNTQIFKTMYDQPQINFLSRHGVGYFDKGNIRVIFINTADAPATKKHAKRAFDGKLTLSIRERQMAEIIEILEHSEGYEIMFFGHANPINRAGKNAFKYNGKTLHEIFNAFNHRLSGQVQTHHKTPEFQIDLSFDFSSIADAKIQAYFCGHHHLEDDFRVDGILYVLLNCSALMGPNHYLTTKYNHAWNRQQGQPNEYAGYVVDFNEASKKIQVFGYGATTNRKVFNFL